MLASARAQLLTLPRRALVITGCRPIYETTAILAVGAEAGHLSTSSLRQRIRCASISSRQPLCHRSLDCASTQNLELMVGVPKYSTDASNNGAGDILGIRRESERERGRERWEREREGEREKQTEHLNEAGTSTGEASAHRWLVAQSAPSALPHRPGVAAPGASKNVLLAATVLSGPRGAEEEEDEEEEEEEEEEEGE
ncbi:unnamed protein product [Prorocentrum cordatum]|uniref:Uncharacterized protein n=1 Tax=Prorocentrum cordatum TaxID=2364126 RepID=A0ABN9QRC2_9DINO|nr:unnamed protein product [Polarella glacialis]